MFARSIGVSLDKSEEMQHLNAFSVLRVVLFPLREGYRAHRKRPCPFVPLSVDAIYF